MATASRRLLRSWIPLVLCVAIAVSGGVWRWTSDSTESTDTTLAPEATPLLVVSATSAYHFDSLEQMAEASDVVITGDVVDTARGRMVGDPAVGGVVSRIVTIRVDEAFGAGATELGEFVLVEEEGWLADGTAIMVDDMTPSQVGDRGVWFLETVSDGDLVTQLVINSQGRYLRLGDHELVGSDGDDPMVRELQALGYDGLVAAIARVHSRQ